MKTLRKFFPIIVSFFFVLLFIYASASKMLDFENFQVQLAQSPLLSAYAGFISYAVIILELVIAGLLCFHLTRLWGLFASFAIMVAFTVYIYLILNYSDFVPCSCGGILEKMSWQQHLVFNMVCVLLALTGVFFIGKERAYRWSRTAAELAFTAILSAGSMVALFLSSEYIMKKENNFTRRFLPHPIDFPQKLNLEVNSFYFAGQHGDTIFLGNKVAPLIMGKVYPSFDKLILDTLKISDASLPFQELKLQVQYPYFSLADGHVPAVFEGEFPDVNAQLAMHQKAYFSTIVMIKPKHYIFRGQSTKTRETIMGLLETEPDVKFRFNTTFLEKQIDGIFDTDGNFVTDPVKQNVIYTYFYRNEYRVLDDQLRFTGQGKTIDTITKAQLKLNTLKDGRIKMNAPPLKVNQDQAAYGGLLFNEANLRGRHESAKMWQQAKVVDVYHYPTATYRYSFYVHHDGPNKMRSMLVTAKHFYILSGNQLIRYQRMR
ncbi:tellurium resistance protein TerC [Chryseobacterium gotjawalense]|uniref:Tellurium resistance protein TerC n=1 Tax=Chryseobacterium gotjawalense TaxID=3042315 RepID=A0ABY8RCT0_9FLAO|nr:MauE/DoxX family redox-associated membrane protein [Chryseobacterium sp. wdc7]WHF51795.1 tellurium resistance protein TerC [Chryseobacterium sp. wdc7]